MSSIEQIKSLANECVNVVNDYKGIVEFDQDYISQIHERVDELLECDKPRLMVCGVYSAGKSTLVNVICRKEVAEVGAEPKTDRVTEYRNESKDYILVDSPGVDAPIEHEKITDDYIKKCNAIMFVVSTKNAESEANYRKINEWMEYEKPLFIVLNDKSGSLDLNSPEINVIREKIEENLRKSGYDRNKKYDVIAVNAKMGLKGLDFSDEVKRKKLFDRSNITQLESLINSKMKEGYSMYLAPIGELQRVLDNMETELMALETNNDDKELLSQLEMIEKEGIRINDSIKRRIKRACSDGTTKLINVYMNADSQDTIDKTSNQILENILTSVDDDYRNQIEKLSRVINTEMDKFGIQMSADGIVDIKGVSFDFSDMKNMTFDNFSTNSSSSDSFNDLVKNTVQGAALGETLGAVASTAAKGLPSTFLAGAGGKLAGLLGPIGLIGGALLGLGSFFSNRSNRNDDKEYEIQRKINEENRRRQAAMDAQYKKLQAEIGSKMDDFEVQYSQQAAKMLSLAISNLKETINLRIAEGAAYNEKISEARKRISALKASLEGLKNGIR